MKSNGLLKWLMIPIVLILVFVGMKLLSGSNHSNVARVNSPASQLTPQEMKSLGISGDTPLDTVATLVAQVKQLRGELKVALERDEQGKAENERLRAHESTVDQRVQDALNAERDRERQDHDQAAQERQQTQSLLQDLQHRFDHLNGTPGSDHADLPVGLGLEDSDDPAKDGVRWIEPQDERPGDAKSSSIPRLPSSDTFHLEPDAVTTRKTQEIAESASEPVGSSPVAESTRDKTGSRTSSSIKTGYTIPANATLMGSVAMTALIGRVPVDGTVTDAFPFKIVVGEDVLTANGVELPEVAGAIVSGTASGDSTLSCVRGRIRSITFVFHDGIIRTLPSSTSLSNEASNSTQGGLGWISDPYGVPCVSGALRTNAAQYLTSQALITAAGAGAASLIPKDSGSFSFISGANGSAIGATGITGNEAMGRILAGGVQDMSKWVEKLYGQAFAAVYVPPGAPVAIHIDEPLEIDYDPRGRRVRFENGGTREPHLD